MCVNEEGLHGVRMTISRRVLSRLALCGALAIALVPIAPAVRSATEPSNRDCSLTAGQSQSWGAPSSSSDFGQAGALEGWTIYDSVGHAGNGRRTPTAVTTHQGVLTITGDAAGDSGGMAWWPGRQYGRWEVCAKVPIGSPNYHPALLLWPDSNLWPAEGEIDFMEIWDLQRHNVSATVHHLNPADPATTWTAEDYASHTVDATQWHSWAVDWAPGRITGYLDGVPWFEKASNVPAAPMHLCIQLDNFGGDVSQGGQLLVSWARQYQNT